MNAGMDRTPLTRDFFDRTALDVAPGLPGHTLARTTDESSVEPRPTEAAVYAGQITPGLHAFRDRTARNSMMSGPPGHACVCSTYGMSRRAA